MDITVTDAQLKVLRKLDPVKTAKQVVQLHVDTWLLPHVQEMARDDEATVKQAYASAAPDVRARVRTDLGLV
jgi:hypothetical protein